MRGILEGFRQGFQAGGHRAVQDIRADLDAEAADHLRCDPETELQTRAMAGCEVGADLGLERLGKDGRALDDRGQSESSRQSP